MHSLAWGVPAFRPGVIIDVGGNYRWSDWGASGFCHCFPEMNVKPAFVAFATMTWMLDGAKFVRDVPLGSPSLYGAEFARPDGSQVFVLWTLRGQRPADAFPGRERPVETGGRPGQRDARLARGRRESWKSR